MWEKKQQRAKREKRGGRAKEKRKREGNGFRELEERGY